MRTKLKYALLAATAGLMPLSAQAQTYERSGWGHGWDWGWGGMMFGGVMMIVFWGGLIALIVLAVRSFGGGSAQGHAASASGKTARNILESRFARGEIDKAEFEERKRALSD